MKKRGKMWLAGPAVAVALAFTAVAATPALDSVAAAVDVSKACTLTVSPGSADLADDLAGADVVIDLYKVADAVADSAYDTYSYNFLDGYTGLTVSDKPDNAEWKRLSREAAQVALNGRTPEVNGAGVNERIPVPGCGLYLVVARGRNITDYKTTAADEDGTEGPATIAHSQQYTYTFAPSLVSLPGKEAEDGVINTAGAGDWLYDLSITLKPQRAVRYGSLEIVKTLQSYETKDPATFVFQVDAVLGGQNVYSGVVAISFTAPGQRSKLIEKLPVGAQVTVKEVYTGAVYSVTTADTQTVTILANDVVQAPFTNDYDETDRGGGAVINQFEHDAESGWGWTKVPDTE